MCSLDAVYACSFSSAEAYECSLCFLILDVGIKPLRSMRCVCLLVLYNDGNLLMCALYGGSKQILKGICKLLQRDGHRGMTVTPTLSKLCAVVLEVD